MQKKHVRPACYLKPSLCRVACPLTKSISQRIQIEVAAAFARVMAEDAAQWDACFGDKAPTNPKKQREKIVRIASTRAFLSLLNKPE